MYGINEIRKQNAQKKADHENSRDGTFCVLKDGTVLLRKDIRSRMITEEEEVRKFLTEVRDKPTAEIKAAVLARFED